MILLKFVILYLIAVLALGCISETQSSGGDETEIVAHKKKKQTINSDYHMRGMLTQVAASVGKHFDFFDTDTFTAVYRCTEEVLTPHIPDNMMHPEKVPISITESMQKEIEDCVLASEQRRWEQFKKKPFIGPSAPRPWPVWKEKFYWHMLEDPRMGNVGRTL